MVSRLIFLLIFFALTHFITDMLREKLKTLVSDPRSTVLAILAKHTGLAVWNYFPDSIQKVESVPQFKNNLKKHFLAGT